MQDPSSPPSVNSWLEEELYQQYQRDRQSVDMSWAPVFESNGHTSPQSNGATITEPRTMMPSRTPAAAELPAVGIAENDQVIPLRGPALKIAENMEASLAIPVATSQRSMPVKVMEENRRLI